MDLLLQQIQALTAERLPDLQIASDGLKGRCFEVSLADLQQVSQLSPKKLHGNRTIGVQATWAVVHAYLCLHALFSPSQLHLDLLFILSPKIGWTGRLGMIRANFRWGSRL